MAQAQAAGPPWRPGHLPSWRQASSTSRDGRDFRGQAAPGERRAEFWAVEVDSRQDFGDSGIDHLLDDELRSRAYEFEEGRPATAPALPTRPNTQHDGVSMMTPRTKIHIQSTATHRLGINKRSPPRSRPASPIRRSSSPTSRFHSPALRPSTSPAGATSTGAAALDMHPHILYSPRPSTATGPVESIPRRSPGRGSKSLSRPTGSPPRQRPILTDPPLRFHIPARPATGNKGYTSDVLYPMATEEPLNADMRTACVITQLKKRDRCRRKQFRDLMTTLPRSSLEQSLEDQLQRMTVRRKGFDVENGMLSSRSIHYVAEDSEEQLGNLPLAEKPFCLWEKGANIDLPMRQLKRVDAIIASTNDKDLRLGRRKVQSNFDPLRGLQTSPAALRPSLSQRQQRAKQDLTENWEEWLIGPTIWRDSSHYARLNKAEAQQLELLRQGRRDIEAGHEGLIPPEVSARYFSSSLPTTDTNTTAASTNASTIDQQHQQSSSSDLHPIGESTVSVDVGSLPSGASMGCPTPASRPRSEAAASRSSFLDRPKSTAALPRSQSVVPHRHILSAAPPARNKSHSASRVPPANHPPRSSRSAAPSSRRLASQRQYSSKMSASKNNRATTSRMGDQRQRSLSFVASDGTSFGTSDDRTRMTRSLSAMSSRNERSRVEGGGRGGGNDEVEVENMYSSSVFREYLWRKGYRQPATYQPAAHTWPDIEPDLSSDGEGSEFEFSEDKAARRAARKAAAQKPWLALQVERRRRQQETDEDDDEEEDADLYDKEEGAVRWEVGGGEGTGRSHEGR